MTPGQRAAIEILLETRELAPEISLAVELLLEQEDGALSSDQVHTLVLDLLQAPQLEEAEVRFGGIIER